MRFQICKTCKREYVARGGGYASIGYCSYTCRPPGFIFKRIQKTMEDVPYDCRTRTAEFVSEKHDEVVIEVCKKLQRGGYRAAPTSIKCVPDAVVSRGKKKWAVEVEMNPHFNCTYRKVEKYERHKKSVGEWFDGIIVMRKQVNGSWLIDTINLRKPRLTPKACKP